MRALFAIALLLGPMTSVLGSEVVLTSPDHARTFAYGEMVWHQLSFDPGTHALTARITFSNLPYAGGTEARADEAFDFGFPGTQVDRANRTIFVRDRHGKQITIARFHGNPAYGWIDLTSEAKILLIKKSGHVTAVLTATSAPRPGMRWIQMDDNWSLQNLFAGCWRGGG